MRLSEALLADLRDLAVDVSEGGYTQTTVALLHRDLRRCVPSALGAAVVVHVGDLEVPLRMALVERRVERHEIKAALRLPLELRQPADRGVVGDVLNDATGWIELYAAEPGAFDAVVRELAGEGAGPPVSAERRPHVENPTPTPALPEGPLLPGSAGLTDFSQVHRALGVLWNRGFSWSAARDELRRRADLGGTDLPGAAASLIASWS